MGQLTGVTIKISSNVDDKKRKKPRKMFPRFELLIINKT